MDRPCRLWNDVFGFGLPVHVVVAETFLRIPLLDVPHVLVHRSKEVLLEAFVFVKEGAEFRLARGMSEAVVDTTVVGGAARRRLVIDFVREWLVGRTAGPAWACDIVRSELETLSWLPVRFRLVPVLLSALYGLLVGVITLVISALPISSSHDNSCRDAGSAISGPYIFGGRLEG